MSINESMIVYKNKEEKRPKIRTQSDFSTSDHFESIITMDLHTGTHIDAPLHMIENGNTLEGYPLENFIQNCKVIDMTHLTNSITKDDLINLNIQKNDFILFKTQNSFHNEFNFNFIYLDQSAASYLAEKGIVGVGIDALGIERNQPNHETHKSLLSKEIIILEGLRLGEVSEGEYTLCALPLKIDQVEASPTRAILISHL